MGLPAQLTPAGWVVDEHVCDSEAVRVHQAWRFALDPSAIQRRALASHCGAARKAFNWGLEEVESWIWLGDFARVMGLPRTESPEWNPYALRREWNAQKDVEAPWWRENSKEAYSSGLAALANALRNWSESRKGKRAGPRVGFPRFRKRGRPMGCRFTTGTIRVDDERHVTVPRVVVEDLNVAGMTRSARGTVEAPGHHLRARSGLNRSLADASFGEFRRQLEYKCRWYGAELVVADRFFPSSKTCSRCGELRTDLRLEERMFGCDTCGLRIDRDLNAAINLAGWAHPDVADSAPETENACPRGGQTGPRPARPVDAGTGIAPEPAGMTGGRHRAGLTPAA